MNLEDWLCKFDAKKMALECCEEHLYYYEQEEPEEFHEIFSGKEKADIEFVLHSVAYVINTCHEYLTEDGTYKYISVRIRLRHQEEEFAEYQVIFGLDGEYHDDYFRVF